MPDGPVGLFDYLFDLQDRHWPSLGSLDSDALVRASNDALFSAFSLWEVSPSGSGLSNFVDAGTEEVDYELFLDPGDQARHDIGILGRNGGGSQ